MYAKLKKKYGQNFLIDNNILNKIIRLIPSTNLNILEIGPGNGKLTDKIILKNPNKFTIIEIDKDLIEELSNRYLNYKFIDIINADILDLKIDDKYELVVSNLPYNISSQIIVKISLLVNPPDKLILMFQKEFAQRLLDKKINSINSLIRCFYDIRFEFNVSRNSFRPIPKVDSSVLFFKKKDSQLLKRNEIESFIEFKRYLFSHKRKTLKNLLKKYNLDDEFNLKLRVENLDLASLIKLFRKINF